MSIVPDSILQSLRKAHGLEVDDNSFDIDIAMAANTIFSYLNQIGVGANGFKITDDTTSWSEFVPDDQYLEEIKTYVYLRVKLIFDPPTASNVLEAYQENIREAETRIFYKVDPDFKGGVTSV